MAVENVIIDYRDRPDGSESKLNTYSDGFKVLKTIIRLYKNYKPRQVFTLFSFLLVIIALIFFVPVFITYIKIRLVPQMPTLVMCGFVVLAAIQSYFSGLILSTIAQKKQTGF